MRLKFQVLLVNWICIENEDQLVDQGADKVYTKCRHVYTWSTPCLRLLSSNWSSFDMRIHFMCVQSHMHLMSQIHKTHLKVQNLFVHPTHTTHLTCGLGEEDDGDDGNDDDDQG